MVVVDNRRIAPSSEKVHALQADGVFSPEVLASYRTATLLRWATELNNRVIPENARSVHVCVRLPGENALDAGRWTPIQAHKEELARDDVHRTSIFTRIRAAVAAADYATVSALQLEMAERMEHLDALYRLYKRNLEPA